MMQTPLITDDSIVFGLLLAVLGVVFYTRSLGGKWSIFYTFVPAILLCYLIPSLFNSFGLISSKESNLWNVAKNYFLPASLVLMTLSIDLKAVLGLGPKALIMFFTGTVGIILGGPIAILLVAQLNPETMGGDGFDAAWRGFATLAGSWIGGGANQTAMLEVYQYNPNKFAVMIAVDIIVANIWMAFLLYGAGNPKPIDRWLKADTSSIDRLIKKMEKHAVDNERVSTFVDLLVIAAVAFGGVGLAHFTANVFVTWVGQNDQLSTTILASRFFWVIVIATTFGMGLSFTRVRKLEGAGASKLGSVFIFILVAIIGTRVDVFQISDAPEYFLVGVIWMVFHVLLLVVVARIIHAPFFFLAVGSKANVGGAASAPVLAAAFHPSLAPVGVLLAVLGYALGTYGAIICAELMHMVLT